MAEIAEKYSNGLIITNDNPRWEDPHKIKKDIMKGLKKLSQANFIYDRDEAIKKGFYLSLEKDMRIFKRLKEKNTLSVTRKLFRN